jgi:hypothetical protein
MIAKHVPMRSIQKSDFADLVDYITDEQSKRERVEFVNVTNCHTDDPAMAILEVMNTQSRNTRSTDDKTYHLIVSFRAGEYPDADTLRAIESRICAGLGYGEHQRVSALHTDTDNVHLHIAINKIHPTKFTIHTPYNDHKTLGALCERLERDYGLEPDNHRAQKTGAENRAGDMERHAGIESLLGWIQRECLDDLKAAQNWNEFNSVLADNGLTLKLRGNGFVITDGEGTMVKSSSVAREYSKAKLENRFGPFEGAPTPGTGEKSPARSYAPRPLRLRVDTTELYARYQADQQARKDGRAVAWSNAREGRIAAIENVKRTARLKRAAIRLMGGSAATKRMLYAMTSKKLLANIERISKNYRAERDIINAKYQRQAWADWLRTQAAQGDRGALEALRARPSAQTLSGNTVTGSGISAPSSAPAGVVQDSVTKKGTVVYAAKGAIIRDDGKRLKVAKGTSHQAAYTALRMAMDRYGSHLSIAGTDEFKNQVVKVAALAQLAVTFDDLELERRRQALIDQHQEVSTHGKSNDRGRGTRSGVSDARSADAGSEQGQRAYGRSDNAVVQAGAAGKPDVGRIGRNPPPESQNRLRNLSSLGVVRFSGGGEVLLPGHVSGHVEHERTQSTDALRRSVDRPGMTDTAWAAADMYIQERNRTRLYVVDIPEHKRYTINVGENMTYGGLRTIDGQALALLRKEDQIFVLPVDNATAIRLRRIMVGSNVSVIDGSIVQPTKGRKK